MELDYELGHLKSRISYGETVVSQLKKQSLHSMHCLIITNQRYYDLYADKFLKLFDANQSTDWYICTNDSHCNNFNELENLLLFLNNFDYNKTYVFWGIGNEGVMQLTSFIKQASVFKSTAWLVPLSIRSLSTSLLSKTQIESNNQPSLELTTLAEKISFDHTLIKNNGEGKLVDFQVFIRCGLVCSHDFLRMLFRNFKDQSRVKHQSFSGLIEALILFYQVSGEEIDSFGKIFESGFSEVSNGHLLSSHMKKLLGCLLQLLWSQRYNAFSFHYENFLVWLVNLGFPIDFPEQISVSEYVESLLGCVHKQGNPKLLDEIGVLGKSKEMNIEELIELVEAYQLILNKIKGEKNEHI